MGRIFGDTGIGLCHTSTVITDITVITATMATMDTTGIIMEDIIFTTYHQATTVIMGIMGIMGTMDVATFCRYPTNKQLFFVFFKPFIRHHLHPKGSQKNSNSETTLKLSERLWNLSYFFVTLENLCLMMQKQKVIHQEHRRC